MSYHIGGLTKIDLSSPYALLAIVAQGAKFVEFGDHTGSELVEVKDVTEAEEIVRRELDKMMDTTSSCTGFVSVIVDEMEYCYFISST